jgi:hypothetical protein
MPIREINPVHNQHLERVPSAESPTKTPLTSNTTLDGQYGLILVDATSGNINLTLPSCTKIGKKDYYVQKVDSSSNTVTLTCDGSDTIRGDSTLIIHFQWSSPHIASDSVSTWSVI